MEDHLATTDYQLLELGKEKQESLAGTAFYAIILDRMLIHFTGLNDKEIEDRVTGLVKTGI